MLDNKYYETAIPLIRKFSKRNNGVYVIPITALRP